MAKSSLPPPPPPTIGAMAFTSSPALILQFLDPAPMLTLPSFLLAKNTTTLSNLFFISSILAFISPLNSPITTLTLFIVVGLSSTDELAFLISFCRDFISSFSLVIALIGLAPFRAILISSSSLLSSFA